jgi:hypothetical protein
MKSQCSLGTVKYSGPSLFGFICESAIFMLPQTIKRSVRQSFIPICMIYRSHSVCCVCVVLPSFLALQRPTINTAKSGYKFTNCHKISAIWMRPTHVLLCVFYDRSFLPTLISLSLVSCAEEMWFYMNFLDGLRKHAKWLPFRKQRSQYEISYHLTVLSMILNSQYITNEMSVDTHITWNHWVSELWPSSGILSTRKQNI